MSREILSVSPIGGVGAATSKWSCSSLAAARRLANRSCAEKMEKPSERTNIQRTAGQYLVGRKRSGRRRYVMRCKTTHSSTDPRTTQVCENSI